LRVWRGRDVRVLEKRNEQAEEMKCIERLIFLHNIKVSSFGGTKKLYWMRVLRSFRGFI